MLPRIIQLLSAMPRPRVFLIACSCALFGLVYALLDTVFEFGLEATFFIMAPVQVFAILLILCWSTIQLNQSKKNSSLFRILLLVLAGLTAGIVVLAVPVGYIMSKHN